MSGTLLKTSITWFLVKNRNDVVEKSGGSYYTFDQNSDVYEKLGRNSNTWKESHFMGQWDLKGKAFQSGGSSFTLEELIRATGNDPESIIKEYNKLHGKSSERVERLEKWFIQRSSKFQSWNDIYSKYCNFIIFRATYPDNGECTYFRLKDNKDGKKCSQWIYGENLTKSAFGERAPAKSKLCFFYNNPSLQSEIDSLIITDSPKGILSFAVSGCKYVIGSAGAAILNKEQIDFIKKLNIKHIIIATDSYNVEREKCQGLGNYLQNEIFDETGAAAFESVKYVDFYTGRTKDSKHKDGKVYDETDYLNDYGITSFIEKLKNPVDSLGFEHARFTRSISKKLKVRDVPTFDNIPYSHMGDEIRFLKKYENEVRFVELWNEWISYNAQIGIWSIESPSFAKKLMKQMFKEMKVEIDQVEDEQVREKGLKHIQNRGNPTYFGQVLELVSPELSIKPSEVDSDINLAACKNGVLNLNAKKFDDLLKPFEDYKTSYITKCFNANFDIEAVNEFFLSFINEICTDNYEKVDYIRKLFGLCLTGRIDQQTYWYFEGKGADGKSKLNQLLLNLLGDYGAIVNHETFLKDQKKSIRNDIADFEGKRCIVSDEFNKNSKIDSSLMKSLTGNEYTMAEQKFQKRKRFRNQMNIIIELNHLIRLDSLGTADQRRVRIISFALNLPKSKRDGKIMEKLLGENENGLDGFMLWCLSGLIDLNNEDDNLPIYPEMKERLEKYWIQSDDIYEYILENYEIAAGNFTYVPLVWKHFKWYSEKYETHNISNKTYLIDKIENIQMSDIDENTVHFERKKLRLGHGMSKNSSPVHCFTGLALKKKSFEAYDASTSLPIIEGDFILFGTPEDRKRLE